MKYKICPINNKHYNDQKKIYQFKSLKFIRKLLIEIYDFNNEKHQFRYI